VPGTTRVRIVGNDVDEFAPIDPINSRRILIQKFYPSGTYQATVAHGDFTSPAMPVTIQ
jgi:hypothetical protein